MSQGIYFKEDIVQEMSKEFNIPMKEIMEIVNKNLEYIKKSVEEKPILLISLPNLTKLRFNLRLGMSSRFTTRHAKSVSGLKKYKSLSEKIGLLSAQKAPKLVSFNKPLFERLYKKITKEKTVTQIYNKMYSMWAVVEKKSNEILNKIQ